MNAASPFVEILDSERFQTAIVEPGGIAFTRKEVLDTAVGLARYLTRQGLAPGDRVVLQVPNGLCFAASALAVLFNGGVPVLIEPGLGDEVYNSRVRAADAAWALVHPTLLAIGAMPGARRHLKARDLPVPPAVDQRLVKQRLLVTRGRLHRWAQDGQRPFSCALRTADDEGVLVFTGGTTRAPKGVLISHGALSHYLANIQGVIEKLNVTKFLADTPQQVLYALRLGKTAYITKGTRKRRADSIWELLSQGAIDTYFGSPYVWTHMIASRPAAGRSIPATFRNVLLGGAPVTREFLTRLYDWLPGHVAVQVLYGLTEAGPVAAVSGRDKLAWTGEGDLVGAPVSGVGLETDGVGPQGEVLVSGPALYSGYLGEEPRPASAALHTGDVGRLVEFNSTVMLALVGRQKDMIIRNGVNIYPLSFEEQLRAMKASDGRPLLRETALVGRWNPDRQDEDVILFVQPEAGRMVDPDTLKNHAATLCGPDAAPDEVVVLDEIPVTGRQNKVDKNALRSHLSPPASRFPPPASDIPFSWRFFLQKQAALWLDLKDGPSAVKQAALHLSLLGVNQVGWLADGIVAKGWENTRLCGPLFILGHQRSGTTFLHRLLSADEQHARALKFHEMLLPSTFIQQRIQDVARLDRRLGSGLAAWFQLWQKETFGPLDHIHRLRFDEIEEDEFVLWTAFQSAMCANDSPLAAVSQRLDRLRQFDAWSTQSQHAAMAWYRACVLKKVHRSPRPADGHPPWPVSKNPAFSQKIPLLSEVFPDARFILLVRNPLETIPSRLSLIEAIWQARFPWFESMTPQQARVILDDSLATYLKAESGLDSVPEDRKTVIKYTDFIADPTLAIRQIYKHFSLPGPDLRLTARLEQLQSASDSRKSLHSYELGAFGLGPDDIVQPLRDVFARYGFMR